jgi:hypothetical protein
VRFFGRRTAHNRPALEVIFPSVVSAKRAPLKLTLLRHSVKLANNSSSVMRLFLKPLHSSITKSRLVESADHQQILHLRFPTIYDKSSTWISIARARPYEAVCRMYQPKWIEALNWLRSNCPRRALNTQHLRLSILTARFVVSLTACSLVYGLLLPCCAYSHQIASTRMVVLLSCICLS